MSAFTATAEHVQQFHADGYVMIRSLFSNDEIDLVSKIARADHALEGQARNAKDAGGRESRISLANTLDDGVYSTIVQCRRVADTMEALLGDEVYHYHHKMMMKQPKVGGAWEWHQDYGYWYNNDCLYPDMASCFIAVDRATKENGCLQVLKASHRCGRIDHGRTGSQTGADLRRVEALIERLDVVYCQMQPGDALFFHSNTLHRSDANDSDHPRWTFICCYNTKHNDPFTPQRPNAHPNYAPLPRIDDAEVLKVAQAQWSQLQATV